MPSEIIELEGHIIDSLILAKVMDRILESGGDYRVLEVEIGRTNLDPSHARLEVTHDDEEALEALMLELQAQGANPAAATDATLETSGIDGVLPAGFYSTTNLTTSVRVGGRWLEVENPEMDCAIVVRDGTARTVPMHRVRADDPVVVGTDGVRVKAPEKPRGLSLFEFMSSEVSSEKPKEQLVARVAERMRAAREAGGRLLAVCGPAVVHTGAAPAVARLVREGWIDVLFAGNGFATHDIESNVLGTSLGVPMHDGSHITEVGHSNHLRVINEVRRHGSIAKAVEAGYVSGGVMYECVRRGVPFVLGGSLRDDGPLPDVITDVVEAADTMRSHLRGITVALMLATTLHAIATGNLLRDGVETFCVDINQAVVTKLADRGSHQAVGVVTDVGLFTHGLVDHLCGRG